MFSGSRAAFYHECFKMVDILMHHFERNIHLNPHAKPYEPKQEVDEEDIKEENQKQQEKRITNLMEEYDFGWKLPSKIMKRNENIGGIVLPTSEQNNNAYSIFEDVEEGMKKTQKMMNVSK